MKDLKKITGILIAVLFCLIVYNGVFNIFSVADERIVYGDIDGDNKVDIQDATLVLREALLMDDLNEASIVAADVDGDLEISLNDAQLVLKYALNIINAFPVIETDKLTSQPNHTDKLQSTDIPIITESSEQTSSPFITYPSERTDLPNVTNSPDEQSNILIAYFSKTGTTQSMAEFIQQDTGGTLYKIQPVEDYPQSYQETVDIVRVERETDSRPKILNKLENIEDYDVVFVGFPKL